MGNSPGMGVQKSRKSKKGMHNLVCACSGHSTGTSLESYMNPMNLLRSMPATNALHGNTRNINLLCQRWNAIGTANQEHVEKLMEALFVIDVPDFQPGQRLNIILETCFASMIRHLSEIVRSCGVRGGTDKTNYY
jgi:hypothetical protein